MRLRVKITVAENSRPEIEERVWYKGPYLARPINEVFGVISEILCSVNNRKTLIESSPWSSLSATIGVHCHTDSTELGFSKPFLAELASVMAGFRDC